MTTTLTLIDRNVPFNSLVLKGAGFVNPRPEPSEAKVLGLARDLGSIGLLNRLIVWETEFEGKDLLVIIGGQRRYKAIELIRTDAAKVQKGLEEKLPLLAKSAWDDIKVSIFKGSLADAMTRALADNLDREDLTAYEVASQINDLEKLGKSQRQIAVDIGKSTGWVSQNLTAFRKSSKAVLSAWRQGKITDENAYDLARKDPEKQDKELEKVVSFRSSGDKGGARSVTGRKEKSKADPNKIGRRWAKKMAKRLGQVEPGGFMKGFIVMLDILAGDTKVDGLTEYKEWNEHQAKLDEAKAKKKRNKAAAGDKAA